MNISDILIVYLTFGAPIAVYKYLQTAGTGRPRRAFMAVLTLTFWIPDAARLGRRYLSNAYLAPHFVSSGELECSVSSLSQLAATAAHVPSERRHLIRRTAEQTVWVYAALCQLENISNEKLNAAGTEFLRAGGSSEAYLGAICLQRRNRRKLVEHRRQARDRFLELINDLSQNAAVKIGLDIATALRDEAAIATLTRMKGTGDECYPVESAVAPISHGAVSS